MLSVRSGPRKGLVDGVNANSEVVRTAGGVVRGRVVDRRLGTCGEVEYARRRLGRKRTFVVRQGLAIGADRGRGIVVRTALLIGGGDKGEKCGVHAWRRRGGQTSGTGRAGRRATAAAGAPSRRGPLRRRLDPCTDGVHVFRGGRPPVAAVGSEAEKGAVLREGECIVEDGAGGRGSC